MPTYNAGNPRERGGLEADGFTERGFFGRVLVGIALLTGVGVERVPGFSPAFLFMGKKGAPGYGAGLSKIFG
jgi:hypothetical protein